MMKWTLGEKERMDQSGGHSDASLWILVLGTMKKKQMREKHPGYQYSSFLDLEKKWNIKTETFKLREQNDEFVRTHSRIERGAGVRDINIKTGSEL